MSLDITFTETVPTNVFSTNITHNLGAMAEAAGIYKLLWCPEELEITKAAQLIEPLTLALASMRANRDEFKKHDARNGWGTYDQFLPWLDQLIQACREHPNASISIWK